MKPVLIIFVYAFFLCWGCTGHKYHPSESHEMKILDPPICFGDDSIKLPDTTSSDFIPSEFYPELIHDEPPQYPVEAEKKKVGARVILKIYVDKNGNVARACAVRCSDPGLGFEEAAVKAALRNKYRPIVIDEEPIGQWIDYTINYIPED